MSIMFVAKFGIPVPFFRHINGILSTYETCRNFCGIAVGDSIFLSSSSEMHYGHIAPVETYTVYA